jgi:hypothetical protein
VKEADKFKEKISIKKQYIFEKFNYEKKITLGIMGIGIGISAYLFKYPFLNWFLVFLGFLIFSSIYESFFLLSFKREIGELIKEIKKEKIKVIDPLVNQDTNFIAYLYMKGNEEIKCKLMKRLFFLILIIGFLLFQLLNIHIIIT